MGKTKHNPLSRVKAINRTTFRNDPSMGTIKEFKRTMTNMLKNLVEKLTCINGRISGEMKTMWGKKNQMEMLEIKITPETKNSSDGLIKRWDTVVPG